MPSDGEAELEELEVWEAKKRRAADMSTLGRRSALNFVGGALFGLFTFVSLVVVARGLGPERSGTFLEGVAFFMIATSIVTLGFDESMVRAVSRALALGHAGRLRDLLLVALGPLLAFSVLVAAVSLAVTPEVTRILGQSNDPALATYLRIFALALPATSMYYAVLAATRGFGTMAPTVAIERVWRPFAQAVGAGLVVAAHAGAIALALAWTLPFVLGLIVGAFQLRSLIRHVEGRSSDGVELPSLRDVTREFWRFSSLRGLASAFQTTFMWVDTLIVGALVSAAATGIYTTSSRLVRLGSLVLLAIVQAVGPQISEFLALRERGRAEHVYRVSTWWLMTLTWPIYITMAIFAPVFLRIFGSHFSSGAEVVTTMCLAMLLSTAVGAVDMVLLMGGKSGWNLINSIVALVANISLNLILIPHLGIEGAAIAWTASVALNNLLPWAEVRTLLHISPFAAPGAVPAVGAVISFGIVGFVARLALGPHLAALVLSVAIGSCLYLVVLRRFGSSLEFGSLLASLGAREGRHLDAPTSAR
jgi:O-antigen/teichoic acid export membrane protein